jgi:hypothetical protein
MPPRCGLGQVEHFRGAFNVEMSLLNMVKLNQIILLLLCVSFGGSLQAGWFSPSGASEAEKKANIRKQRDEILAEFYSAKPEMKDRLRNAAGYATFNQKDLNVFLFAGAKGYGVLHDNRTQHDVFMRVAALGGGVGLGLKSVRVVFVFNDAKVMQQFVDEGWQFGGKADASAKYKEKGASASQDVKANVDFRDGTVAASSNSDARIGDGSDAHLANATHGGAFEIYQFTETGISVQASVVGTKYWKDQKLNR